MMVSRNFPGTTIPENFSSFWTFFLWFFNWTQCSINQIPILVGRFVTTHIVKWIKILGKMISNMKKEDDIQKKKKKWKSELYSNRKCNQHLYKCDVEKPEKFVLNNWLLNVEINVYYHLPHTATKETLSLAHTKHFNHDLNFLLIKCM